MNYDEQEKLLAQQRARYIQQQDQQAPQGRMVGNRFVAANPLEYLAAGLRGYGGFKGEQQTTQELGDLQKQKQEAMQGDMNAMITALRGKPAETVQPLTPNDDEGNVNAPIQMPAKAGSMDDFYRVAAGSQFPQFQQMGMQGALTTAQDEYKKAQAIEQQKKLMGILQAAKTPQEALAAGVPAETVKSYYESQNYGKNKVVRTIDVIGANGEKMTQQIDEYGNAIGAPIPAYTAPVQVNQGGQVSFVVPKAGVNLPVTMSPSEKDASARGWATVKQGQERIGIEKTKAANAGAGGAGAAKPLTESQAKGSLYLGQMRTANDELDALEKKGVTASPASVAAAGSTWTNWATGPDAQRVAQLENQWSEGFLRAKTGAAATTDEVKLNRRTFFPVVGDSQEVIKQKKQMRRQAEKDMEIVAGNGAAKAGGASGGWDANEGWGITPIQ